MRTPNDFNKESIHIDNAKLDNVNSGITTSNGN